MSASPSSMARSPSPLPSIRRDDQFDQRVDRFIALPGLTWRWLARAPVLLSEAAIRVYAAFSGANPPS